MQRHSCVAPPAAACPPGWRRVGRRPPLHRTSCLGCRLRGGSRRFAGARSTPTPTHVRQLCVIDTKPHHEFAAEQYNMLIQFAELCVREIEKDKASAAPVGSALLARRRLARRPGAAAPNRPASPAPLLPACWPTLPSGPRARLSLPRACPRIPPACQLVHLCAADASAAAARTPLPPPSPTRLHITPPPTPQPVCS